MTFEEYQQMVQTTALYADKDKRILWYPTLGLTGEAGEVAEKVKKLFRNEGVVSGYDLKLEDTLSLKKELGDVLWYVAALAHSIGSSLEDVASTNATKLLDRLGRGVIKSTGDNR